MGVLLWVQSQQIQREREKKNHKNNDGLNDNNNYDKTYAGAHERVEMKAMA